MTKYEEFEKELLKKPGVRQEYEALKPKYDMIRDLIRRRNELGFSQKRLAELVGTQQPAISRLERGDYNTTLSTFFKVAQALGLEVTLEARSRAK